VRMGKLQCGKDLCTYARCALVWNGKSIMSNSQKTRFLADRLHHLTRLGLQLPPEYRELKTSVPAIAVEQSAIALESQIMDLPDGRTLYVISLSLIADVPGTRLDYFRIEPPWPDSNFETLPRFEDSHVGEYYKLPGGLEFLREDILNFNFVKSGWRLPGNRVEGLLCAVSTTPIPDEFKHGAAIPVRVLFFNHTGQQLASTTAQLWADRPGHLPQRAKPLGAKVRRVEPKGASNPPASSAAALPPRSNPGSSRQPSDLWAESKQENGSATATSVHAHAPRSVVSGERDETRRGRP